MLMRGAMPAPGTWIAKDRLEDGAYYSGKCRNAVVARWSAKHQRFFYWRTKFGARYVESLKAPEDDTYWDVFVAESKLATVTEEILFLADFE